MKNAERKTENEAEKKIDRALTKTEENVLDVIAALIFAVLVVAAIYYIWIYFVRVVGKVFESTPTPSTFLEQYLEAVQRAERQKQTRAFLREGCRVVCEGETR